MAEVARQRICDSGLADHCSLHHWVGRLEGQAEEVRRITDDITYRRWRLHITASAYRFRSAGMNLYQVLLSKPLNGKSVMPLTRADWYRE